MRYATLIIDNGNSKTISPPYDVEKSQIFWGIDKYYEELMTKKQTKKNRKQRKLFIKKGSSPKTAWWNAP